MFSSRCRKIDRLDFILIGAQKSGTTALRRFLHKHPAIDMGDKEEMHFFDNEKIFAGPVDYELLHKHFSSAGPDSIVGECTPSYIFWPPVAERIWQYNAKIKLLVILRNPVDRAFAHWNMQRFKGREPLGFLDALKSEKERTATRLSMDFRRFSYTGRGYYSEQLERFFQFFPRQQVKIVRFEEFRDHAGETLALIFEFLGVRPVKPGRNKDRNVVPYERTITASERKHLQSIFADEIDRLERLLGWDCSDWKR